MNRLRQRCFAASIALHGLLLALMFFGSGFLDSRRETVTLEILTFIPEVLTDAPFSGGGNPSAPPRTAPPRPAPPAPAPVPKAREPKAPEPRQTEPKSPPRSPKPDEAAPVIEGPAEKPKTARRPVEVNLTPVVRGAPPVVDREKAERERAAEQARLANLRRQQIERTVKGINSRLSDSTVAAEAQGPGGGGPVYANWEQYAVSVFDRAWDAPEEVAEQNATAKVRVVIARDGRVLSAEFIDRSGLAVLDKSVRAALDRVETIGLPFPEGARETERTLLLNFRLKPRRATG